MNASAIPFVPNADGETPEDMDPAAGPTVSDQQWTGLAPAGTCGGRPGPCNHDPVHGEQGTTDAPSEEAASVAATKSEIKPTIEATGDDEASNQRVSTNKPRKIDADQADTGGMSGTPLWRPQYHGRIRSYSDQKGFGFIDCMETHEAFHRDVFLHRNQMAESSLKVNQEVVFEVELNKMGHPQARCVRPAAPLEGQEWDYQAGMNHSHSGMSFMGGIYGGGMMHASYPRGNANTPTGSSAFNYGYMHRDAHWMGNDQHASMGMASSDMHMSMEPIEEMLRSCSGSIDMWEIIEKYGHTFGKKQVVTALYQLGLCRQHERRTTAASLTGALVDRLVQIPPRDLTADEASRVLWALAILDEVRGHNNAHRFAMDLGGEALKRCHEFNPSQMASFVNSLSRLVRSSEEDELVGKITMSFSDYALGSGSLPRFPAEELRTWQNFLQEASSPGAGQGPPHFGMPGHRSPGMGMGPTPYSPQFQHNAPGMGMPPWPGMHGGGRIPHSGGIRGPPSGSPNPPGWGPGMGMCPPAVKGKGSCGGSIGFAGCGPPAGVGAGTSASSSAVGPPSTRPGFSGGCGPCGFGKGDAGVGKGDAGFNKGDACYGKGDGCYGKGDMGFGKSGGMYPRGEGFKGNACGGGKGDGSFGRGDGCIGKGDSMYCKGDGCFGKGYLSMGKGDGLFGPMGVQGCNGPLGGRQGGMPGSGGFPGFGQKGLGGSKTRPMGKGQPKGPESTGPVAPPMGSKQADVLSDADAIPSREMLGSLGTAGSMYNVHTP